MLDDVTVEINECINQSCSDDKIEFDSSEIERVHQSIEVSDEIRELQKQAKVVAVSAQTKSN